MLCIILAAVCIMHEQSTTRKFASFNLLQLLAEYKAVIPEEARDQNLRTEWHKIRDAIIEYSKSAKSTSSLSELLLTLEDEFDEGMNRSFT